MYEIFVIACVLCYLGYKIREAYDQTRHSQDRSDSV